MHRTHPRADEHAPSVVAAPQVGLPGRPRIGMVSTFPPSRCGIARFSQSLSGALCRVDGSSVEILRLRVGEDRATSPVPIPEVVMEFDPDDRLSVALAARRLSTYDVAVIQHEFGIYGRDDGYAAVDLVQGIEAPTVVVLHTVLPQPGPRHRRILEDLAGRAASVVVPSGSARDVLVSRYEVPPERVVVIPHGSHWQPADPAAPPRRRVLTWGLLGPGKGLERAIRAIAELRDLDPPPLYRIVGQIHPNVLRREGTAYREALEDLIARLGAEDIVEFDDRYQDEMSLWRHVSEAHVVVLPYDNHEQICSGVLTEAVSAGRPVVATAFPHAVELLANGAGLLVGHDDHRQMAEAIRALLLDDALYARATEEARAIGGQLPWEQAALGYLRLFERVGITTPAVA